MMNEFEEPPRKKIKLDADMFFAIETCMLETTAKPLKVVLNDEISKPLPLIKVFIGHIKDVKAISKTILLLNEKLPLKDLQHLKRVRQKDVVLCPSSCVNGSTIQEYLVKCEEKLADIFDSFDEVDVPFLPPKLKSQFEDSKKYWPCNFHPDKYLEKLFSAEIFSKEEDEMHRLYMHLVFVVAKWFCDKKQINNSDFNVTAIVDPRINSVVAISTDNRVDHPVQHSAMLAIDNVARTQNGGAWELNHKQDEATFIDAELLVFLKKEFSNVKFGHRKFVSKRNTSNDEVEASDAEGPYLCTGYYVYMLREPCVMCSMGLVHARARRIFFAFDNEKDGALKSKAKLQTIASLNHRFEVFTGFL